MKEVGSQCRAVISFSPRISGCVAWRILGYSDPVGVPRRRQTPVIHRQRAAPAPGSMSDNTGALGFSSSCGLRPGTGVGLTEL